MFQIGDRVKIKNSTKEYILKEFKNNNESCIIKDGIEEIVVFVNCLELVEEKIYFTGREINLDNKIGATAKVFYGFDKNSKKYICVEICTNNIIKTFFEDLQDVNVFLKSLGFKEVIEKPFDLVEFLKENLTPKEFKEDDDNIFLNYDYIEKRIDWDCNEIVEIMGTIYFEDVEFEKLNILVNEMNDRGVTPEQLKEAYKKLGWL